MIEHMCRKIKEGVNDRDIKGTMKCKGRNLIIWEHMGWDWVEYAIKIDGRVDGDLFIAILRPVWSQIQASERPESSKVMI